MNDESWARDLLIERLQADSKALGRIKAATQAAGWPVGETLDDLVAAVAAVSAGRDALAADHARLAAERDQARADNERLLADSQALAAVGRILVSAGRGPVSDIVHIVQGVADVLDERERLAAEHKAAVSALDRIHDTMTGRGYGSEGWEELARAVGVALEVTSARAEVIERIRVTVGAPADASCWGVAGAVMAEVQRLRDELAGYKRAHNRHTYAPQALCDVEDLLTKAGYIDEDDDEDDIGVVTRALEDALRDLKLCQEALARISTALTATGRDADSCGHGGPADVADAVEEALLDLSARWRGRDEALERIREAMDLAPSSPADIADFAVQMITMYWRLRLRAVDVLPDAPATGGDCGGEA